MYLPMRRYEREVVDPELIEEMLRQIKVLHLVSTTRTATPTSCR